MNLEDISQNAKQCKPSSPVFHQLTSDMSVCHNYVKYTNKSAEAENLGGFSGHIFASLARIQFEDVRPPLNLSPPSHLLTRSSSSSIVLFAHFVKMSKAVAAPFLASLQQKRKLVWRWTEATNILSAFLHFYERPLERQRQ